MKDRKKGRNKCVNTKMSKNKKRKPEIQKERKGFSIDIVGKKGLDWYCQIRLRRVQKLTSTKKVSNPTKQKEDG